VLGNQAFRNTDIEHGEDSDLKQIDKEQSKLSLDMHNFNLDFIDKVHNLNHRRPITYPKDPVDGTGDPVDGQYDQGQGGVMQIRPEPILKVSRANSVD
jgi:hypothetical protein